jgi:hypothetical protein
MACWAKTGFWRRGRGGGRREVAPRPPFHSHHHGFDSLGLTDASLLRTQLDTASVPQLLREELDTALWIERQVRDGRRLPS